MILLGCALLVAVVAGFLLDQYVLEQRVERRFKGRLASLSRAMGGAAPTDEDLPETERLMARLMMSSSGITRLLLQADWKVTAPRFIAFVTVVFVAAVIGIWFLGPLAGVAAAAVIILIVYMRLNSAADKKSNEFLEELPNFLERLRQLISTGNSQTQAFDKSLAYSGEATRCYLDPVSLRMKIGVPLPDAMRVQAQRLGIAELAMLAMIVRTNLRYGGNLGYILEHLARVLRDRIRVRSEFKALSSELRTTAMVMVAIPPLVALAILVMNPNYLTFFAEEGQGMLGFAIGLEVIGILVMRRLMRVEY